MKAHELISKLNLMPYYFDVDLMTELTGTQIQDQLIDIAVSDYTKKVILIGTEFPTKTKFVPRILTDDGTADTIDMDARTRVYKGEE